MSQAWITHCPDPERWLQYIEAKSLVAPSGCQEWTGSLNRYGYAKFRYRMGGGRRLHLSGHRAHWLAANGDIPEGMVVDHLCRNRSCVNLDHLEVVTIGENVRRGETGRNGGRPRTCPHGRDDGYLFTDQHGYTRWTCRICRRAAMARYRARQRALRDAA